MGTAPLAFDQTRVLPFRPGSYRQVLELQRELREQRIRGETPDLILLGEHERVVTRGRRSGRGNASEPLTQAIPVVEVERGGEDTWHGPGQLVGYPIVNLRDLGLGVRQYMEALEQALIEALAEHDVTAGRRPDGTGVWVGARKIASLGVAVRRSVTCHGFALNVAPDLRDFALIQPCGFAPGVMTSMREVRGTEPSMQEVTLSVLRATVRVLGLAPPIWERGP